jgi:hypothetical protein
MGHNRRPVVSIAGEGAGYKSSTDRYSDETMSTEQRHVIDRVLVHDVHTTVSDEDLRQELWQSYQSIKYIKRLYHMDGTPKQLVQIVFKTLKYAEIVLQEGFIANSTDRYPVKALKSNDSMR